MYSGALPSIQNPNYQSPAARQQMNSGFGVGGMQPPGLGSSPARPPMSSPYTSSQYAGMKYNGPMASMPYGQANAMTWQQIGGILGMGGQDFQNQIMGLNPWQRSQAAEFAQRRLGVPVPGDGAGVTINRPNPIYAQAPNRPAPPGVNDITNMINQKLAMAGVKR